MTKPSYVSRPRRISGVLALILGIALALTACSDDAKSPSTVTVTASASAGATSEPPPSSSAKPKPKTKPVHVKLFSSDGVDYGVGMPIIAFFSKRLTDATEFQKATTVTVNDTPVQGAWYFETSAYYADYPIEAHYRLKNYWPAHATVHMELPVKGLSAGRGLHFDNSLTLDFTTHARNIAIVDAASHSMSVTTDGKPWGTFPVSLGAPNTPTARGTKVVMEKGKSICMSGPGYSVCDVKFTQRLTYGGEYLHSAPWNIGNIGRADTSNGCTNMLPADAEKLYGFLQVGDVVMYPNASGERMELGDGYGDWNVPWSLWQTGGLVRTHAA